MSNVGLTEFTLCHSHEDILIVTQFLSMLMLVKSSPVVGLTILFTPVVLRNMENRLEAWVGKITRSIPSHPKGWRGLSGDFRGTTIVEYF